MDSTPGSDHPTLDAQEVAAFLQGNPQFFVEHADVFATLDVPHPYATQAISLGERQVLTLRARAQANEARITQLLRHADGNERTTRALLAWCAQLLAQADARALPELIVHSLGSCFELDGVALRVWDLDGLAADAPLCGAEPAIRDWAASLAQPYCGPFEAQPVGDWLAEPPASLAILPLRTQPEHGPVGLLVLASRDPERYRSDMGTDFLELIAQLAGAALARLQNAAHGEA